MLRNGYKIAYRKNLHIRDCSFNTRCQNTVSRRQPLHGFTLIELLVVIAIIALLVSILLPSLTKAKELAKTAVCMSQQKSFGLGFAFYFNEYDGALPPYGHLNPTPQGPHWFDLDLLGSYIGMEINHFVGVDYMRCPTADPRDNSIANGVFTYGVNYGQVFNYLSVGKTSSPPRNVSQLSPSTYLLGDASDCAIYNPNQWVLVYDPQSDGFPTSANAAGSDYNFFAPRHNNKEGVCVFADGSVRTVSLFDWATNVDSMWGGC